MLKDEFSILCKVPCQIDKFDQQCRGSQRDEYFRAVRAVGKSDASGLEWGNDKVFSLCPL